MEQVAISGGKTTSTGLKIKSIAQGIKDLLEKRQRDRRVRQKASAVAKTVHFFDERAVAASRVHEENPLVQELNQKGFVFLGSLGIDVDTLAARADELFSRVPQHDPDLNVLSIANHFFLDPAAGHLLKCDDVNAAIKGYIGEDAVFGWSMLLRIPRCSATVHSSGMWHHDCLGRHLKLFVFLHDVESGQRTTKYAVGTNTMRHHGRWWGELTRYAPEEVEGRHEIVEFTGKKGEAVLFDTSGLHRGTWEANDSARDILKFCFASSTKASQVADFGLMIGVHTEYFPKDMDLDDTLVDVSLLRNAMVTVERNGSPERLEVKQYGNKAKAAERYPQVDALTGRVLVSWPDG